MNSLNYNNRKLRISAALVAAVYIVLHGRLHQFLEAITSPGFYIAVAVSFISALLLVYLIHIITIWLDTLHGWRIKPVKRSLFQVVCGIIIPSFLDVVLMFIYFKVLGQNIFENDFFLVDFPIIVAFITILNLYYLIHYLLLTEHKTEILIPYKEWTQVESKPPENSENAMLSVHHNGQHLQFDISHDILCFYRFRKHVKFIAFNGDEYPVKGTLRSVAEQFKDYSFLQINRSVVLNFSIVENYQPGLKRNTLELLFKRKYLSLLENQGMDWFVVTKEHISKVSQFFNNF